MSSRDHLRFGDRRILSDLMTSGVRVRGGPLNGRVERKRESKRAGNAGKKYEAARRPDYKLVGQKIDLGSQFIQHMDDTNVSKDTNKQPGTIVTFTIAYVFIVKQMT